MMGQVIVGYLAVSLAGPLLAATREATVISSETDVVRVSVFVADKNGRPVTDLRAEDFVLLDEGRPQELALFLPATSVTPSAVPAAEASPVVEPSSAPASPTSRPRHVLIVVDDLHLSGSSLVHTRPALKQLVEEQLRPEDEVALATSSGSGVIRAFTRDRAALLRAVDALQPNERRPEAGGRAQMSVAQAQAILRNDSQALSTASAEISDAAGLGGERQLPRAASEARAQAQQIVAQALQTSNAVLSLLEDVVRSLKSLPGSKVVVFVSDGFMLGPAEDGAFDMRRLIDASARADVAVYPLLAQGLQPSARGADARGRTMAISPGQQDIYARVQEMGVTEAMTTIADGTGGRYIRGSSAIEDGLRAILGEQAASYVLGYSPDRGADGRFHKIEVKVQGRPGLTVRARRGYFARTDAGTDETSTAQQRERDIRAGLFSVVDRRDLDVRLRAAFVDRAPEGAQVVLSAHVDGAQIPFRKVGERQQAELEFVRVVADDAGRVVAPAEGKTATLDLTTANYERTLADGLAFQSVVPLRPGHYEARMLVRESRTGRLGTARQWIEIRDVGKSGLALSDLLLFAETPATATAGAALRDVSGSRRYRSGASLYYSIHVYNPARGTEAATDVVAQAQIHGQGALQGASPVEPVAFAKDAAAHALSGRIGLEGLAPGGYELRVLVVDRRAGGQAERRIDFAVD